MTKFFNDKFRKLVPYVPGEQPKDAQYIKLNTNESPFPPPEKVTIAAAQASKSLQLYSDPENAELSDAVAAYYKLSRENVLMTNGSDEILNLAFTAFAGPSAPLCFPDVTYGFYTVLADFLGIPYECIPLEDDFTVDYQKYCGINKTIVLANPNAPTGILMPISEIEEIVASNPENVVIIDEAYIDFCGAPLSEVSAVSLTKKYNNLIVTQTFSKSRSLAGGRLGFGVASAELIQDMNTIKFATNPYNVNRMTAAAGIAAIEENDYFEANCRKIIENREYTKAELEKEGFKVLPSSANFLFVKADYIKGIDLYTELKKEGILVRHFETERLKSYNRITIGTKEQMDELLAAVRRIKNRE